MNLNYDSILKYRYLALELSNLKNLWHSIADQNSLKINCLKIMEYIHTLTTKSYADLCLFLRKKEYYSIEKICQKKSKKNNIKKFFSQKSVITYFFIL